MLAQVRSFFFFPMYIVGMSRLALSLWLLLPPDSWRASWKVFLFSGESNLSFSLVNIASNSGNSWHWEWGGRHVRRMRVRGKTSMMLRVLRMLLVLMVVVVVVVTDCLYLTPETGQEERHHYLSSLPGQLYFLPSLLSDWSQRQIYRILKIKSNSLKPSTLFWNSLSIINWKILVDNHD